MTEYFRVLHNDSCEPVPRDDGKIDLSRDEVDGMILHDPRPFSLGLDQSSPEPVGYQIRRAIEDPDESVTEIPLDDEQREYFTAHIAIAVDEKREARYFREDQLRDRWEREDDIGRGLGIMPSAADLRQRGEDLAWASIDQDDIRANERELLEDMRKSYGE